ncbi:hypothetical protein ATE84_1856 [Aquimarina sp. MAR_2010_214]|uniref:hypothetical protein n=1 Tax=Aquimarina sp. MAR_2010_214 TaxID=1250026 RepID=UPI000C709F31|nr:hypothetical protein [Aquimarina sp. MAR_2010_214]PKV49818.1 hypothetical protein ATE84_1856 [Aquimarina sp. MAR_2010_214]
MKTSILTTKLAIFSILFLSLSISNAQIIYEDQLETVYLNENAEEVVYTNSFSNFNNDLIAINKIDFKNQIQKANQNNDRLLFLSERSNLEILTATYLKIIRKSANRSNNSESFKAFLNKKLPELINQFKKDNNLEELYIISRKNTFNGKIDALPSVL